MDNIQNFYHNPVMLEECLQGLNIREGGVYVDVTFGGGGHSKAILKKIGSEGKVIAFDQDEDAKRNLVEGDSRFSFVQSNFKFLSNWLRYCGVYGEVDGILADLGVSSHQFDEKERGFSFRENTRLDMRMNQSSSLSAYEVINQYEEEKLANLMYLHGELHSSKKIARSIVEKRKEKSIETTMDLVQVVKPFISPKQEKKELAMLFQSIRIEVNRELEALKSMLLQTLDCLKPQGRLVVMTYHSLEDRLVKNFMHYGNFEGKEEKDFFGKVHTPWTLLDRKVQTPSQEEIELNPRSRSAKLRIVEKK
ncbi:MAG TPA: 16S rRNA (cytosine(1402)-N(4))-methyltransferase [Porphyromonadaceae bacterium]|nr:16S rRNA (cytosine(1402)-N(4))-methyltransferase [Porphyromonadaceae bacterium]